MASVIQDDTMNDAKPIIRPDRASIRAWVAAHTPQLELAQAESRLGTARLDLKDGFKALVSDWPEEQRRDAMDMLAEEIEAACQDLRLAQITVQSQIERTGAKPQGMGCIGVFGILILAAVVLPALFSMASSTDGMAGLIAIGCLVAAALVLREIARRRRPR